MPAKYLATTTAAALFFLASAQGAAASPVKKPAASAKSAASTNIAAANQRKTFNLPELELEVMLRNHKISEATALLNRTRRVAGDDDARKIYRACILNSADETEQASALLDQVHDFGNAATPILVLIGKAYAGSNQLEKALKISTIAYNRDHTLLAGDLRAAVLMQLKRYKEACEQYIRDARTTPSEATRTLCEAASVQLYDLHNPSEALKEIELAQKSSNRPESTIFYSKGECLRALNQPKEAIKAYTDAINLERNNRHRNMDSKVGFCYSYRARATVYKQLGMLKEAAADTRELDKLSTEAADILINK